MAVTPVGTGIYRWSLRAQDLKTAGTTSREIVQAVTGKYFVMTQLQVVRATFAGTTSDATISLGVGSAHAGNLFGGAGGVLVDQALAVVQRMLPDAVAAWSRLDVGTNGIWFRVQTASTQTTDTADVHLFGFYD